MYKCGEFLHNMCQLPGYRPIKFYRIDLRSYQLLNPTSSIKKSSDQLEDEQKLWSGCDLSRIPGAQEVSPSGHQKMRKNVEDPQSFISPQSLVQVRVEMSKAVEERITNPRFYSGLVKISFNLLRDSQLWPCVGIISKELSSINL